MCHRSLALSSYSPEWLRIRKEMLSFSDFRRPAHQISHHSTNIYVGILHWLSMCGYLIWHPLGQPQGLKRRVLVFEAAVALAGTIALDTMYSFPVVNQMDPRGLTYRPRLRFSPLLKNAAERAPQLLWQDPAKLHLASCNDSSNLLEASGLLTSPCIIQAAPTTS